MDFGQMKLHIRDVLFQRTNSHHIKPTLVIRGGIFQVISGVKLDLKDIEVCRVTKFEMEGGFTSNRWNEIAQAAMTSWKEYTNVKNP